MVMKHTQFLDTIRNIKKQWVSFLSIVLIVTLAVMAYLGINYSASAMKNAGQIFYDDTNYKDIEMVATLLMSDIDLEEIRKVDGVKDVEGVYQTSGRIDNTNITIESITDEVNVPILVEGELPDAPEECVLEERLAEKCKLKVGDKVTILNSVGENAKYLKYNEFTITGLVHHPDHVTVRLPENLYALVMEDAFDKEELEDHFMKAEIVLDSSNGKNTFTEDYFKAIKSTEDELRELSVERAEARDDEIRTKAEAQIAEAQAKLDEAKAQLDAARAELDAKQAELSAAKAELDSGATALSDAWAELESGKTKLNEAKTQLDSAKTQLDAASSELLTKYNEMVTAKNAVRAALIQAISEKLPDQQFNWAGDDPYLETVDDAGVVASEIQMTNDVVINLGDSLDTNIHKILMSRGMSEEEAAGYEAQIKASDFYTQSVSNYNSMMEMVTLWDTSYATYNSKKQEYEDGLAQYNAGMAKYNTGLAEYNSKKALYDTKKAEYDAAVVLINQKEREYSDGYTEYENGLAELEVSKQKLANLDECKWFEFNRKSNAAYVDLNMVANNLSSLGMSFSLLFVVVGAMVCYATIGRMVDEQRTLVGATKALGFFNGEIFAKYLSFGVSSTLIGIILGIIAAYFGLQKAILAGYANMYVVGEADKVLTLNNTLIVAGCGLALSVIAIILATTKLLKMTAISLMKEETPRSKAKSGKGKKGGSLYGQLIVANIMTDLRRIAVTIVSVAGCCALLVIGFTLKFSVDGVMKNQFSKIVKYSNNINYNPEQSGNTEKDIEAILEKYDIKYYNIFDSYITYQVTENMEIGELLVVADDGIQDFHALLDWKDDSKLEVPDDGIMVQKRLAETYDINVGDEITVYDNNAKAHTVKVSAIFNNYTGRTMVMKDSFYEEIFGIKANNNRYLAKLGDVNENSLRSDLKGVKGFTTITRSDGARALFASISTILNALIVGLIFMAGMMAVFVLLNLANTYVLQKERELTIMRINGFTLHEVKSYVLLETYVTTAIGILVGFAGGSGLAYRIIRSLEKPHIQLIRHVSLTAWLISGVLTAIIAMIIYQIAVRRVKDLELTL